MSLISVSRQQKTDKRFVSLDGDMFTSKAFLSLSKSSILVLLKLLQNRTWGYSGKGVKKRRSYNNHGLVLTYTDAMRSLNISRATFARSLQELFAVGFIEFEHHGGAYMKDFSRYHIIDKWRWFGDPGFKPGEKPKGRFSQGDRSNVTRKKSIIGLRNDTHDSLRNETVFSASVLQ